MKELKKQLEQEEDRKYSAYRDHLGYLTIGVGRLIDPRKGGRLSDEEIDFMLDNDVQERYDALSVALPWFLNLDPARQGALLNMAFQLGLAGLLGFVTTLDHVAHGRYEEAAEQMLRSKWARQTPERAARVSKQMRTGEWQYKEG